MKYACNSNNVGYQLGCDTCLEKGQIRTYEGESSRSARIRGAEHLYDLRKQRPSSVLFKHKLNEQKEEEMVISMKSPTYLRTPNQASQLGCENWKKK